MGPLGVEKFFISILLPQGLTPLSSSPVPNTDCLNCGTQTNSDRDPFFLLLQVPTPTLTPTDLTFSPLTMASQTSGILAASVLALSSFSAQADVLPHARAYWVRENKIAVPTLSNTRSYALKYCEDCSPSSSMTEIPLYVARQLTRDDYAAFPNLESYTELDIDPAYISAVPSLLKGGLAVIERDSNSQQTQFTGVQISGVLDDLYGGDFPLGVGFNGDAVSLSVWAPTAVSVKLSLYSTTPPPSRLAVPSSSFLMQENSGVWTFTGNRTALEDQYYLYEVDVFVPETGNIETNMVTDPYSVSLSMNSLYSQIIDLDSQRWKPNGWDNLQKPDVIPDSPTFEPEDIVLYELHIREFSSSDSSIPADFRGKYKAFTQDASFGVTHLKQLANAGMTHVHLLPSYDCGSIPENPADRVDPDPEMLATFPGNSYQQQEIVGATRTTDSWNWCYDPFHYSVPEGSYATNPNISGGNRILEYREMVQAINEKIGLRVVLDVVYNHQFQAGQFGEKSVLDKIVPGYYFRLDSEGRIQTTTCCPDTATEFFMMERLMIDTMQIWLEKYKVDGFRFDLMGHHTRENIANVKSKLSAIRDDLYIYGEGWEFGSGVAKGLNMATQFGTFGLGVGTFNDRIRDSMSGGSRDDPSTLPKQGFVNGLSYDWNGEFYENRDRDTLLYYTDRIKVGLAGNLQAYTFIDRFGSNTSGVNVGGTGYASDPSEVIQYVSAHDDHCHWDKIAFKVPESLSPALRGRVQNLAIATMAVSQGVPFFTAGIELMRSKSLDRDSYDSGDWFNTLDYSMQKNNFPRGMPPMWRNSNLVSVTTDTIKLNIAPDTSMIRRTFEHMLEFLRIRKSSRLFRLRNLSEIQSVVRFYNSGPSQASGIIPFMLYDQVAPIVVIINADKFDRSLDLSNDNDIRNFDFTLHPVLQESSDSIVRQSFSPGNGFFTVPARTTAVFVGSDVCSMNLQDRQDCGFVGVDARQCSELGCCWSPDYSNSGAPWCFDRRQ